MSKERAHKVNELIKRELGRIISGNNEFSKDTLVTITRVETSSNIFQTKVYISVIPENKLDEVFDNLNKNIFNIQKTINKRLEMRPVPKIIFAKEKKTSEAGKVEELLEEIKNQKH